MWLAGELSPDRRVCTLPSVAVEFPPGSFTLNRVIVCKNDDHNIIFYWYCILIVLHILLYIYTTVCFTLMLQMNDQLDCALDLMRRLPPQQITKNLCDLVDLVREQNTLYDLSEGFFMLSQCL